MNLSMGSLSSAPLRMSLQLEVRGIFRIVNRKRSPEHGVLHRILRSVPSKVDRLMLKKITIYHLEMYFSFFLEVPRRICDCIKAINASECNFFMIGTMTDKFTKMDVKNSEREDTTLMFSQYGRNLLEKEWWQWIVVIRKVSGLISAGICPH